MADEDKDSKTEEPTGEKLGKARSEGQVPMSQEVRSLFMLSGALIVVWTMLPWIMGGLRDRLLAYMDNYAAIDLSVDGVRALIAQVGMDIAFYLGLPIGLLALLALTATFTQVGLLWTPKKIQPKLSTINPMQNAKQIFSVNGLVELLKSIFKFAIVMTVGGLVAKTFLRTPDQMVDSSLLATLDHVYFVILMVLLAVVMATVVMAVADLVWQRHKHRDSLKMSKQEVKEEARSAEGDPQVKAKIKSLRLQRARQRMMQAVPQATVVITNPTHYAVALKYEMETMAAPVVVAKGTDKVALKIRELATENDVPIVENPPLARALYAAVELEQEIPSEHYKAVAEVIGYIMKIKAGPRARAGAGAGAGR